MSVSRRDRTLLVRHPASNQEKLQQGPKPPSDDWPWLLFGQETAEMDVDSMGLEVPVS